MSARPPLYIHIGLRKAASTTLQRGLFAKLPGLNHFGMWHDDTTRFRDPRVPELIHRIILSDGVNYDRSAARVLAEDAILSKLSPAHINTLSDEKLGGFWRGYADRRLIAERLKDLFGDIRIIVMVREQIEHFLANYIALGGEYKLAPDRLRVHLPVTDHLEYMMRYPDYEQLGHLKIGQLTAMYADIVGRENVCVLVFEEMRDDMPAFATRIGGFLGVDPVAVAECLQGRHENPRRKTHSMLMYRTLRAHLLPGVSLSSMLPERVQNSFQAALALGRKSQIRLPAKWVEQLREYYAEDNARLAGAFGLDLARWGYSLPCSSRAQSSRQQ
jgi:hypothetical protein